MTSYWELLGNRSPDFWAGVKEGVTAYGIWRDGTRLVGCMEQPLKEVLAEIDEVAGQCFTADDDKIYAGSGSEFETVKIPLVDLPDATENRFIDIWLAMLQRYEEHSEEKGDSFQDVELNFLRTKLSEEFREVCTAISDQTEYDEVVDLILVALMLGSRLRDGLNKEVIEDGVGEV